MDTDPKTEALIRYLYDEGPDPGLETDPALKAEHAALAGVKSMLEARPAARPEDATLAAVYKAAAAPPRTPIFALHRWRPLAAAAVVLVAFGMGLWMMQQPAAPDAQQVARSEASGFAEEAASEPAKEAPGALADQDVAPVVAAPEAEVLAEEVFKAEDAPSMRLQSLDALNTAAPTPGLGLASAPGRSGERVPTWDEADALRALYWRVNALNARSENMQWDEPIPLEQVPLDAAGKNRTLRVDMKR